ncbi:MAG: hypothetical protein ACK47B_10165 [Armatimonadota bacterium]
MIRAGLRPLTLCALGLFACGLAAAPLGAQEGGPAAPAQPLPLKDVVLFSSGVGYFQRRGTVRGTTSLKLSFRAGQVNDILKSLVLIDPQGQVRPVTYTTQDAHLLRPGVRALATGSSVSLGALLRQFQGARLRVYLAKEQVEGRLVSVSSKEVPLPQGTRVVEQEVLNVLTATGLRAIPLEAVQQVQLLDERLDRELRDSLALLATGLSDEQREVELRFTGDAAREVRAGYLQETPVWKTSYRLVLDDKPAAAAAGQPVNPAGGSYLQGWAIVENTTEEDWKDVRLSLVSGRPISFIQDLYQPLYVPRPVVQPQVLGSPRPQLYGEAVEPGELLPDGVRAILDVPTDNSLLLRGPMFGGLGGFGGGVYPGGGGSRTGLEELIEVRFTNTPLHSAIRQLFQGSGLEYSIGADVPNVAINLQLARVPRRNALRAVLRQGAIAAPGLTYSAENGVYQVKVRPPSAVQAEPTIDELLERREEIGVSAQALAGVASQALGAERGELFEYAIRQPVTLPRGKAAMVPIVGAAVAGERLSIFDPAADRTHALRGVRLKNTTAAHLAGGPITVFDGGTYAGDAQVGHLGPGEERLLA